MSCAHILLSHGVALLETRQQRPNGRIRDEHRQHDRHQHLHALRLRDGADGEWQDARSGGPERGGEPDARDVEVGGEEFGGRYDGRGEEGSEEEAFEGDHDEGDVLVGDEVEDEVQGGGEGEVDLWVVSRCARCDCGSTTGKPLASIASFSPTLPVTNPSMTRPSVIPSQKPVSAIPAAKGVDPRMVPMKETTQPPSATSMPT